MFVIVLEDGLTYYIEGQEYNGIKINNWDEIPRDKKILRVLLTDGGRQFIDYLEGFDYYVMAYDGMMTMSMSTEGTVNKIKQPHTYRQRVYGIRSLDGLINLLYNKIRPMFLTEIEKAYHDGLECKNGVLINARNHDIKKLDIVINDLIEGAKAKEVVCLEMTLTKRIADKSELKELEHARRDGIPDMTFRPDDDTMMKIVKNNLFPAWPRGI